jgi:hypothetical protein
MNNTNEPVNSKSGLSTIQRARFGPGMLLQHEDLELLNNYTRDLSRLLFQSFFGCGVICGLTVTVVEDCGGLKVTVEPGVALSCAGDPVHLPGSVDVPTKPPFDPTSATAELWVELCGKTKCCAPRTTTCSCDDDEAATDCTREKDGWEIKLLSSRPQCACACPEPKPYDKQSAASNAAPKESECRCTTDFVCHKNHYDGVCGCTCGDCSGCDCKCILLAHLKKDPNKGWVADHSVRRFIRPVLMREPKPLNAAATPAETSSAQTLAPYLNKLSTKHTEAEMARTRESLKCFSEPEKVILVKILAEYPRAQRATQLRAILDKYHDIKLAPNAPLQRREIIPELKADLKEASKPKAAARNRKIKI